MDQTQRPQRVALYARVSTTDQDPAMQLHELRRIAMQRGWTVMGEFVDHGVSGTKERRPELDRLTGDVHRGKVDVVAVRKFDRFARSVHHLVSAMQDFEARGINFVSVMDAVDTSTPTGKLVFHIMASLAEFERDLIVTRVKAGLQAAKRRGVQLGRQRVHVDVEKARMLRAEGRSLRQIAITLGVGLATLCRALKAGDSGVVPQTPSNQPSKSAAIPTLDHAAFVVLTE